VTRGGGAPAPRAAARPSPWTGLLAAPTAWFVQLCGAYALGAFRCGAPRGPLHAISAACLVVAIVDALLGWRAWRASRDPHAEGSVLDAPEQRRRFLAELGLMSGGLFTIVIIAQWIAITVLDPCPR
jgi:hypothetical protein